MNRGLVVWGPVVRGSVVRERIDVASIFVLIGFKLFDILCPKDC